MLLPMNGRKLYYDLVGNEGDPVVCLTHSISADSGMWAEQVAALLGIGTRVLRIDMRGHGGSDPLPGDYTMEQLAEDMGAVVDALGIARFHLVSLSIGGMLAQAYALKNGARLVSLMLCATIPAAPADAAARWAPRLASVRKAGSLAPIADDTMVGRLSEAFRERHPARWRQVRDAVLGTSVEGFCGCAAALQRFDFTHSLPSLAVPTLVVCGADDKSTPPAANRQISNLIPGARYEEIASARHFPNIERPEAFNRILSGWLLARRHSA